MVKFWLGVIALIVVVVTFTSGFHKTWVANAEAKIVVGQWAGQVFENTPVPDLLTEYAPLPEYDRAVIKYYCSDIHKQLLLLEGSGGKLPTTLKPGCQALIRGGWGPNWTIADGLEYLADPEKYRLR